MACYCCQRHTYTQCHKNCESEWKKKEKKNWQFLALIECDSLTQKKLKFLRCCLCRTGGCKLYVFCFLCRSPPHPLSLSLPSLPAPFRLFFCFFASLSLLCLNLCWCVRSGAIWGRRRWRASSPYVLDSHRSWIHDTKIRLLNVTFLQRWHLTSCLCESVREWVCERVCVCVCVCADFSDRDGTLKKIKKKIIFFCPLFLRPQTQREPRPNAQYFRFGPLAQPVAARLT